MYPTAPLRTSEPTCSALTGIPDRLALKRLLGFTGSAQRTCSKCTVLLFAVRSPSLMSLTTSLNMAS
jgi:hypothetical protein